MATIQERTANDGKVTYRVFIRLKGYPMQTATFRRKTDARRWVQVTEAAIREGRHFKVAEAKRHTLAELIDRYVDNVLPSKKSQRDQLRHLLWWRKEIGSFILANVAPALIVECRDKLLTGNRTPSTVNRYLTSLSHPFTIAFKEWGWVNDNPLWKVSKLKEPRGRVRFLSDEERIRLLNTCRKHPNPALYTAVVLALSTGARRGEIMNLKWNQVNFERQLITLHDTKNNERRLLPLKSHALEVMQEHYRNRCVENDLVFPGRKDSHRHLDLRTQFETVLKQACIEDFRWHDLRHTCASYLAMNNASLASIAEVLGHKTLSMVKRYAHLSEAHTSSVVESMNRKIFNSSSR